MKIDKLRKNLRCSLHDRLGIVQYQQTAMLAQAAELVEARQRAIIWFRHQPLSGFENKTAEELVAAGHADAVLEHLAMLSDGVYA